MRAMGIYKRNQINFIERNIHGAWVIHGQLGCRQYYGYTKSEARRMYLDECAEWGDIVNQKEKKK